MRGSAIAAATAVLVSFGAMACGSKSDGAHEPRPAEAPAPAPAPPAPPPPQIPAGPVPVALPSIPAADARRIAAAGAFVTIDNAATVRAGTLAPGPTPYAGEPAPTDRTLEAFVFPPPASAATDDPPPPEAPDLEPDPASAPASTGPGTQQRARSAGVMGSAALQEGGAFASLTGIGTLEVVGARESIGVVDVVVLADARVAVRFAVDRIIELGDHRIVLAVQGATAPDAAQYRFGGRRSGTAPPATVLQFDGDAAAATLTVTGKRGATKLAATGAAFTPAAITAAVKREPSDPDLGAVAVRCTDTTTVDQLAQVLAALASLAASEVVITVPSPYGLDSGFGVGSRDGKIPQVRIGQPNATGDLDKAIIRRYVKRNISKITYCYEKQLFIKPKLAGKSTTEFTIEPSGKVSASTASGFDPEVDLCIAGVIKAIEFPKPKGGGTVHVVYPFTFRPEGG